MDEVCFDIEALVLRQAIARAAEMRTSLAEADSRQKAAAAAQAVVGDGIAVRSRVSDFCLIFSFRGLAYSRSRVLGVKRWRDIQHQIASVRASIFIVCRGLVYCTSSRFSSAFVQRTR